MELTDKLLIILSVQLATIFLCGYGIFFTFKKIDKMNEISDKLPDFCEVHNILPEAEEVKEVLNQAQDTAIEAGVFVFGEFFTVFFFWMVLTTYVSIVFKFKLSATELHLLDVIITSVAGVGLGYLVDKFIQIYEAYSRLCSVFKTLTDFKSLRKKTLGY